MKVIALEEHFRNEAVDAEMGSNYFRTMNRAGEQMMRSLSDLAEVGAKRIADMDRHGIDVQVLSHIIPSPECRAFLQDLSLPRKDFERLTHLNAERLLKLS